MSAGKQLSLSNTKIILKQFLSSKFTKNTILIISYVNTKLFTIGLVKLSPVVASIQRFLTHQRKVIHLDIILISLLSFLYLTINTYIILQYIFYYDSSATSRI